MIRAHVYVIGGVPHLHVTRPGGPTESRPMSPAEVVGLLEEVARVVLATRAFGAQVDHRPERGSFADDPPPHYVGALGE